MRAFTIYCPRSIFSVILNIQNPKNKHSTISKKIVMVQLNTQSDTCLIIQSLPEY